MLFWGVCKSHGILWDGKEEGQPAESCLCRISLFKENFPTGFVLSNTICHRYPLQRCQKEATFPFQSFSADKLSWSKNNTNFYKTRESNMIIVISLKGELQRHLRLLHGSNIWETLFPSADPKIISQGRLDIQFSSFTVSHLTAQHLFQNLMRLWNFSLGFNWCFEEVSSYTLGFGVDVLILQSL